MGWVDEDFGHEGFLAGVFADGALSSGWCGQQAQVTRSSDGILLDLDEQQAHPAEDLVGWVPMCSCGWRGAIWMRVFEMMSEDASDRTAFDEDRSGEAPAWVERFVLPEWQAHVRNLHDQLCPARDGGQCLCVFINQVRRDHEQRR